MTRRDNQALTHGQNQPAFSMELAMTEDPRCCGSGTCIIDTEGHCWCGQQWNGVKMAAPVAWDPSAPREPGPPTIDPGTESHP